MIDMRTTLQRRHDVAITLAALALLLLWEASGWDRVLAGWYGNAGGFALRDQFWLSRVLHDGGRWLSAVALLACAVLAWRGAAGRAARRVRLAWFGLVLLCLIAIPAFKRVSSTSCPWDLAGFGGTVPYVPHWLLNVADGGPGHCFPSGHAVAALAFLPLYFQWRNARPRLARTLLWSTLALGMLFGWGQLARGAHFPSHTLWSAWLCWTIGAVGARWLEAGAAQPPVTSPAPIPASTPAAPD
jgi:membrane-associated PAP2 superfamily phosphatase